MHLKYSHPMLFRLSVTVEQRIQKNWAQNRSPFMVDRYEKLKKRVDTKKSLGRMQDVNADR